MAKKFKKGGAGKGQKAHYARPSGGAASYDAGAGRMVRSSARFRAAAEGNAIVNDPEPFQPQLFALEELQPEALPETAPRIIRALRQDGLVAFEADEAMQANQDACKAGALRFAEFVRDPKNARALSEYQHKNSGAVSVTERRGYVAVPRNHMFYFQVGPDDPATLARRFEGAALPPNIWPRHDMDFYDALMERQRHTLKACRILLQCIEIQYGLRAGALQNLMTEGVHAARANITPRGILEHGRDTQVQRFAWHRDYSLATMLSPEKGLVGQMKGRPRFIEAPQGFDLMFLGEEMMVLSNLQLPALRHTVVHQDRLADRVSLAGFAQTPMAARLFPLDEFRAATGGRSVVSEPVIAAKIIRHGFEDVPEMRAAIRDFDR